MLKKNYYASLLLGIILFSFFACSDENGPEVPQNPELDEVISKLEGMTEVSEFVDVLKNVTGINIGEDAITVFAVQDKSNPKSTKAASSDTVITANNIKRHIAKGTHNLSSFTGDSLQLESLGGDVLIVTKYEGKIYINGIALVSTTPVTAGKSHIYKVDAVIPTKENAKPTPKYTSNFIVYECNEEWVPGAAEKSPSANASIYLFRMVNDQYVVVDSIITDNDGKAQYSHSFTELFYTVAKGEKQKFYDNYLVVGLFTSQAEIDNAPQYPSTGLLANPTPGSVKVADINGDGRITGEDRITDFTYLDVEDDSPVEITLISAAYTPPVDYSEKYNQITTSLGTRFTAFVKMNYETDYKLVAPEVKYPALQGLPNLWGTGYNFINMLQEGMALFSNANCPEIVKNDWNAKEMRYKVEMAYVYSCLVNYYGDVPIVNTDASALLPRSTEDEVYSYINMLADEISSQGNQDDRYAATAIAMRMAANRKEYNRVCDLAQGIMNSGKYSLVAGNVFMTENNSETILGGYYMPSDSAHNYVHPIRYAEVLLTYAEASVELGIGNQAVIDMTINPLLQRLNMPGIMPGLSQTETRAKIREIYKIEYAYQALGFMTLKRWDTFNEVLGAYGATEYNKVIPIPVSVIEQNPSITQNPGY